MKYQQSLSALRIAAMTEGFTLMSLLAIAVPLKHLAGDPIAVSWLGPAHGLVFLAYLWLLAGSAAEEGWSKRDVAWAVLAAFIPFGALLHAKRMERQRRFLSFSEQAKMDA